MGREQCRHCVSSKPQFAFCLEKCPGRLTLKGAVPKIYHREILTAINSYYNDIRKKGKGINIGWTFQLDGLFCITILLSTYEVNIFIFTWHVTKLDLKELSQSAKGYIAIKWQSRNSTQNLIPKFLFLPEITIFLLWMTTAFIT